MNPQIYTKKSGRFALPNFQMLGVIFIIWGAVLAYQMNPFSLLLIIAGLLLSTAVLGIQIDLKNKLHREYTAFFTFKMGKWKKLPDIEYATVFTEHTSQDMGVQSISAENKTTKFKICLVVTEQLRIDAGSFDDKAQAIEKGIYLANALHIRLLDYTSKEPGWVKL